MLTEIGLVTQEQAKSAPANIHPSIELEDVVAETDFVIEAISEDLELKRRVFQSLDELCPERTILASNR